MVEAPPGPLLCIAGAGSGKTRTLTYRVARLLETGFAPDSILLLTFTNRAAREMVGRVTELCGKLIDPKRLQGGTFHHAAYALVREFAPVLGLPSKLSVLDRGDASELMETVVAELGLANGPRRFPKGDVLVDVCSSAINTQTSIPRVLATRMPQFLPLEDAVIAAARGFTQRKRAQGLLDFDDLLLYWKQLLVDHPEVRARLQQRFRAVLVDEYQDTNRIQGELVDLLAAGHGNVTVVGDDAQSIYSFRGADLSNLIEFPARYPGTRVCRLTRNYRSSPEILALANASIAHNQRQFPKELVSARPPGMAPALVPLRDALQQAEFVGQRVVELHADGVPLSEMAVLYRAHAQVLEVQLELARRGLPFTVRSGLRFSETAHVKDVLAFLRLLANPSDELAFKRVLKRVPGVGPQSAHALFLVCGKLAGGAPTLEALLSEAFLEASPAKSRAGLAALTAQLRTLEGLRTSPGELIRTLLEGGYREALLLEYGADGEARIQDLESLASFAAQYREVEPFLTEIALLTDLSGDRPRPTDPEERVVLSSIHQAKGLEWRVVFVIGLAEGRFPSARSMREQAELEEERRVFYVACTRAGDELYLTHPLIAEAGDRERRLLGPSTFIQELGGDPPVYERIEIETQPA